METKIAKMDGECYPDIAIRDAMTRDQFLLSIAMSLYNIQVLTKNQDGYYADGGK